MEFFDFNNPQVAQLPLHLRKYIVDQGYERYTPVNHAVWRYVMRQNYSYLKDAAYYPYIPGLKKAGLTIEKIPSLQEINDALAEIGWGAVTVDGFIPPAAFMEYQACRVLVIAADIRQLEHIEYTSAPDIIHESAGHAPIISDVKYNQYLSYLGSIGTKALFSSKDYALYESIRELSILKEAPNVDPAKIAAAEELVLFNQKNLGEPSEMALLSRLQWWTVEYGLIGDLNNPKIYGAGLLSSIGESSSCMRPSVKKIIYTIDAVNYSYDITQPQPQLFVTPTFQNLIDVLQQFEHRMAFRVGGYESMMKGIECKNICTAVYSSGLQVSGIFVAASVDHSGELKYIQAQGPTELAYSDVQLPGHDTSYHRDGFGSPVGKLKGHTLPLENWDDATCLAQGLVAGKTVELNFESGICVQGKLEQVLRKEGKIILLTFTDCTVKDQDGKVYFDPAWGNYDMAVGEKIVSVFNGVADKNHLVDQLYVSSNLTSQPNYTESDKTYHALFQQIRTIREQHSSKKALVDIRKQLAKDFNEDWLASMEILELVAEDPDYSNLAEEVRNYLLQQKEKFPQYKKLIEDGLRIIDAKLRFE
ncbi:MAG: aromatic amino acid hydroxylase [Chitinophagaceae bacterium]|nr:aromatic amino acid hydroxylase [Chitinophagaceae bacterium]MCA6495539.1 aromatic amino acid hydroxylase [Chitinophagaceae bacterium]